MKRILQNGEKALVYLVILGIMIFSFFGPFITTKVLANGIPTVSSVIPDITQVLGLGNHSFTIQFNEPMDSTILPTVRFYKTGQSAIALSGGSWLNLQQFFVNFNINGTWISGNDYVLDITGAKDADGNLMTEYNINTYSVDVVAPKAPIITSILPINKYNLQNQTANNKIIVTGTVGAETDLYKVKVYFSNNYYQWGNIVGIDFATDGIFFNLSGNPVAFPIDGNYFLNATVIDGAGNESGSTTVYNYLIDTTRPVLQSVKTKSPNQIELTFDSNIQIGGFDQSKITLTGFDGYAIDSARLKTGNPKTVQLILNKNLTGAESGKISIISGSGLTENLSENEVIIFPNQNITDAIAPQEPANINISLNGNQVELSWDAVSDADKYQIWRSSSPYQLIATLDNSQNTYIDTDIEAGKTYSYKIIAIDENGNKIDLDSATAFSISIPKPVIALTPTVYSQPQQQISAASVVREEAIIIEESSKTPTQESVPGEIQGTQAESSQALNWPLIIGIILAGLVVLFWLYYWYISWVEGKKLKSMRSFKTLRKIREQNRKYGKRKIVVKARRKRK